jgi:hypothetical protein
MARDPFRSAKSDEGVPRNGAGDAGVNRHGPAESERRPEQLAQPLEPEVPPLPGEDKAALAEFMRRQQVLSDLTLGCIARNHTGAYIHGPPGVSKSYTVLNTLRERQAYWRHYQRITAKPLYLEMEKHPGAVFVIEDCEQLFSEKSALTLLRSALGGERAQGRRERRVSYSVTGSRARVLEHFFYGAIIILANRPLTDEKREIAAVLSRIPAVGHAPPDHEIRAVMRHVARQGHVCEAGKMSPQECVEVIEFVIALAAKLQCRLDLRWIEHAYGHYMTQAVSDGVNDWRDMVKFHVMSTITYFEHTPPDAALAHKTDASKAETRQREIAIAREVAQMPGLTYKEREQLFAERTIETNPPIGRSRATYYRLLAEGRADPTAK